MVEEENHIDQLFKTKLSDRVSVPPNDIWEGVESAMPKSLFFRFRYEQMNIYYCSMIVFCFLFSAVSMIFSVKQYYKQSTPKNALTIGRDSIVKDTVYSHLNYDKNVEDKTNHSRYNEHHRNVTQNKTPIKAIEKDTLSTSESVIKSDSTTKPINIIPEIKSKPKRVKKVVYIMDYDTVVNYDTLRTKRKRK